MKDAMRLLEAIGQIQDEYILDAHSEKTIRKHRRTLAAVVLAAVLLVLAGCAMAAWHWYDVYFAGKRTEALSGGQKEYIHSNAVDYQLSQTFDGYTLELKSTISENNTAYVTFRLTAKENIDLTPATDVRSNERLSFRGLLAMPENSTLPADLSYDVVDDGDGLGNTVNVVLRIQPTVVPGGEAVFGPGKYCRIVFQDIVWNGYDRDYEQKLLDEGLRLEMLLPEQSRTLHPQTTLASGNWEFRVEMKGADAAYRELLNIPLTTRAMVTRIGTSEFDLVDAVEAVTLTSVVVRPLSMEISFETPEPAGTFEGLYLDISQAIISAEDSKDYNEILLMMKDGTKVRFWQYDMAKKCAVLKADSPIILSEIESIHFSDGSSIRLQ